jgi:hypothetical protein
MKKTKPETMENPHFENDTLNPEIAAIKESEKISEENRSNRRKLQQTADRYKKEVEELKKSLHETQRRLEPFLHLESSADILATTPPQAVAMLAATLFKEGMAPVKCIQMAREFLSRAAEPLPIDRANPDWSEFDMGTEQHAENDFEKQLSKLFPNDLRDKKKVKLKNWLQSKWSGFVEVPDERTIGRFTLKQASMCADFIEAGELIQKWENDGGIPDEIFATIMSNKEEWWAEHLSDLRKQEGAKGGNAKAKKVRQGQVVAEETDGRFGSRRVDPKIENDTPNSLPNRHLIKVVKSEKKTR